VSLSALLKRIVQILDEERIPYMLTGPLAAAYYATPRATRDIDIVFEADHGGIERLVERLHEAALYVDRHVALEALRSRTQFNAIEPTTGWKIDFLVRKDRLFSRVEFERRERASLLGIEASLASLEDVLIAKLEWGSLGDSELQRRDVMELLERAGHRIDLEYVERWVRELGLETEWSALRGKATS
jgi:hypothetical protein